METFLGSLDEKKMKDLLLQVLEWRLGDQADLPAKLSTATQLEQANVYSLLETLCLPIDTAVNGKPKTSKEVEDTVPPTLSEKLRQKIGQIAFAEKDKYTNLCLTHAPSLSHVVYHDWKIETQIATESLGRFARPIALVTLRIQPSASGNQLLPPLTSVRIELAKEMIDALSAGFDKLQNQLVKIVK